MGVERARPQPAKKEVNAKVKQRRSISIFLRGLRLFDELANRHRILMPERDQDHADDASPREDIAHLVATTEATIESHPNMSRSGWLGLSGFETPFFVRPDKGQTQITYKNDK